MIVVAFRVRAKARTAAKPFHKGMRFIGKPHLVASEIRRHARDGKLAPQLKSASSKVTKDTSYVGGDRGRLKLVTTDVIRRTIDIHDEKQEKK